VWEVAATALPKTGQEVGIYVGIARLITTEHVQDLVGAGLKPAPTNDLAYSGKGDTFYGKRGGLR